MITVVMALYKPNLKWLKEELISIREQTYKKFHILVWNDNPADTYDYDTFFKAILGDIPFKIYKGEKNMGSNGAFAKLTAMADTPYIAYCDQDDIWYPDKLEVLLNTIKKNQSTLVFSDMAVIDENSRKISQNIAGVRPRQKFYTGKDALAHLLAKNFVTGCTMMMRTNIAQAALPFPQYVFHDWWLAICAAIKGDITMTPKPLTKYRIYSGNQSAVLKGINDKKSYYEIRIKPHKDFIDYTYKMFGPYDQITKALKWSHAREDYFLKPSLKSFKQVFGGRYYNNSTVWLEILLPFLPKFVFKGIINAIKNGKI